MEKETANYQKNVKLDIVGYRYGIDQLEIASKEIYEQLAKSIRELRPISKKLVLHVGVHDLVELKNGTSYSATRKRYDKLYEQGYRSIVRMTCPTSEFFDMLLTCHHIFGVYKPSVIELYKDIVLESEQEAVILAERFIDTSYKKNSTEMFLYVARDPYRWNRKEVPSSSDVDFEKWQKSHSCNQKYDKDIIGNRTLYLGRDDFSFVIYARASKRACKPCVHLEWRIISSDDYKKFPELGITKKNTSYLESLKNLTEFDIADVWEKLTAKHIKHAEIKRELVGKQLADCEGSVKSFDKMTNIWRPRKRLTEIEKKRLGLTYKTFANIYKIVTTSELVSWWHKYREHGKSAKEKDPALHYSRFLKNVDLMSCQRS